tara:strand:+ start:4528 stop:5673 length:1146 start_codon:yes stop_codon:yes gene_type:complete
MLNNIALVDRIEVPSKRTLTDAGQMIVPCKFARTGSQLYTAKQLGLVDRDDNEVITVWREAADVFDADSMESFRSSPVTIGHPLDEDGNKLSVSAKNAKELQVGMLEGMPVQDEDTLGGTLVLTDQAAIETLEDGTQELSVGYICDIEDVDGKYFQRNIRANHIAIVAKGRAGSSCRISDEALEVQDAAQAIEDAEAIKVAGAKLAAKLATDEADKAAKLIADEAAEVEAAKLIADEATKLTDELAVQVKLVDELVIELESVKVELADAKLAANQSVTDRCAAIENARLISDFRDLGDKTIEQIERMVVEDQMPEKSLDGKSDVFISAMFEILVDASQGETPMGKLIKAQGVMDTATVVAKPVNKVAAARLAAIARSKTKA